MLTKKFIGLKKVVVMATLTLGLGAYMLMPNPVHAGGCTDCQQGQCRGFCGSGDYAACDSSGTCCCWSDGCWDYTFEDCSL
jgi:hypothetical protein